MSRTNASTIGKLPRLATKETCLDVGGLSLVDIFSALNERFRPAWLWLPADGPGEVCFGAAARITGDRRLTLTTSVGHGVVALEGDVAATRLTQAEALFGSLCDAAEPDARMQAFGGWSFAPGAHMVHPWSYYPRLSLIVPVLRLCEEGERLRVLCTIPDGRMTATRRLCDSVLGVIQARAQARAQRESVAEPDEFRIRPEKPREHWAHAVGVALGRIAAGDIDKIVLARSVTVDANRPFAIGSVVQRLRARNPRTTVFALAEAGGSFVGATPELLLKCRGSKAQSMPLAGTMTAGVSISELERLKLSREHAYAADAVMSTFEHACTSVVADLEPRALRFGDVTHLATLVQGDRMPETTPLGLADALHPTPAVGAMPRDATRFIPELEGFERGWYAGVVGHVGQDDADLVPALRCGLLSGSQATIYAGCGIVEGSDPGVEFEESRAKLRPMLDALVSI